MDSAGDQQVFELVLISEWIRSMNISLGTRLMFLMIWQKFDWLLMVVGWELPWPINASSSLKNSKRKQKSSRRKKVVNKCRIRSHFTQRNTELVAYLLDRWSSTKSILFHSKAKHVVLLFYTGVPGCRKFSYRAWALKNFTQQARAPIFSRRGFVRLLIGPWPL